MQNKLDREAFRKHCEATGKTREQVTKSARRRFAPKMKTKEALQALKEWSLNPEQPLPDFIREEIRRATKDRMVAALLTRSVRSKPQPYYRAAVALSAH